MSNVQSLNRIGKRLFKRHIGNDRAFLSSITTEHYFELMNLSRDLEKILPETFGALRNIGNALQGATPDKPLYRMRTDTLKSALAETATAIDREVTPDLPLTLNKRAWLVFYNLLMADFNVMAAFTCREQAMRHVHKSFETAHRFPIASSPSRIFDLLSYAAESGSLEHFERMKRIFERCAKPVRIICGPAMSALIYIYGTPSEIEAARRRVKAEQRNSEFAQYVSGKTIAVVGPVNTGLSNGSEIDKFDLVTCFNLTEMDKREPSQFGRRVDFSYYTDHFFRQTVADGTLKPGLLDYYIVHDAISENFLSQHGFVKNIRRKASRANRIFFRGHGNAAQRTLLDLLQFETGSIKLFNMNFWLTPNDPDYYAARKKFDPRYLIYHEPVSSFLLVRNLVQNGKIEVDRGISDLLLMTAREYMQALNHRYNRNHVKKLRKAAKVPAAGE